MVDRAADPAGVARCVLAAELPGQRDARVYRSRLPDLHMLGIHRRGGDLEAIKNRYEVARPPCRSRILCRALHLYDLRPDRGGLDQLGPDGPSTRCPGCAPLVSLER